MFQVWQGIGEDVAFEFAKSLPQRGKIFVTAKTPLGCAIPKESNDLYNMLFYKYLTLSESSGC